MKKENIKLLMGIRSLGEASELTKIDIYPMVVDGMDPSLFSENVYPNKIEGEEWQSCYFPTSDPKRGYYFGNPLHNVTHVILSNGNEIPVVKTTPLARIDESTGKEMDEMDEIYTLANGLTVSLKECIAEIGEMNPARLSK